jgi:hypothetical protein
MLLWTKGKSVSFILVANVIFLIGETGEVDLHNLISFQGRRVKGKNKCV